MKTNIFTEATTDELSRKAVTINEVATCRLHGADPSKVEVVALKRVTLHALDDLCQLRQGHDAPNQFAVLALDTNDVFAVDTAGYSYPRYLGRFTTNDALALTTAKHVTPEPELEWSGFSLLDGTMRDAYMGAEGTAYIGFLGDSTEEGVWQIDVVVDDNGLQFHYHGMNGNSASWNLNMADHLVAKTVGDRVALELMDAGLDLNDCLDLDGDVTQALARFGLDLIT